MILIDNTVLSNFVLVDKSYLLENFCKDCGVSTKYVLDEFEKSIQAGIFKNVDFSWLNKVDFENDVERNMFIFLHKRLGSGEASCLAIAINRRYNFLSDDMMARKVALREGLKVSGSIGILIELLHKNIITLSEGNDILKQIIRWGYFSPYDNLDNFI